MLISSEFIVEPAKLPCTAVSRDLPSAIVRMTAPGEQQQ
jgi:hypothetical protein